MNKVVHVVLVLLMLLFFSFGLAVSSDTLLQEFKDAVISEFKGQVPLEWGENVKGVYTRLKTRDKVISLTLDACGSAKGKGFDARLIKFLEQNNIPATLFINARWIDANSEEFKALAQNPLFEIANHGLFHRPASVNGRSVYGISGSRNISELVDEIEGNSRKIAALTGTRTKYYRSGTAYYDEVAVKVSERLGHAVIGFSILGDAGATYNRNQVRSALLKARPGDIAILHMNHPEGETADGVIAAVPELKRLGFRFVKLSEYELQ
jgi:peptidoglycan/xylan/chitin deacetylase (PgdA/CDA1 family)